MPSHNWGDKDFDWDSLYEAENIIYKVLKFFRIGCNIKEKYGSIRCSVYFWDGGLHSIIWPGYASIQNKFIYYKLDDYVIKQVTKYTGLLWLGIKIQKFGYGLAYFLAYINRLHIIDEIVYQADYPELIWNGLKIYSKYWKKVEPSKEEEE